MKGLELSREYYRQVGRPALQKEFPSLWGRIAAGLTGEGSECFGFDDALSRDHDFGPAFCIWLSKEDYLSQGEELQQAYDRLPFEFEGFFARKPTQYAGKRVGVFEIGDFYRNFLRMDRPPRTLAEWRALFENALAAATNGEVFEDGTGEFSAFREKLLGYYPEDVRLKKISVRCVGIAQSGQYNYIRSAARKEHVAAAHALALFTDAAISLVFLLNKRYMPFYKWMHRALLGLPVLGETAYEAFMDMYAPNQEGDLYRKNHDRIETLCARLIAELKNQGLTSKNSDFLLDHAPQVAERIRDENLRNLSIMVE
jgi:hypothetical protein